MYHRLMGVMFIYLILQRRKEYEEYEEKKNVLSDGRVCQSDFRGQILVGPCNVLNVQHMQHNCIYR